MIPVASDPLVGRMLNQFRIESRLGAGGMGVVYLAKDEKLRRDVALKVLPRSGDEAHRRRFFREARSAAAITHANIAAIYEVGEDEGHVYIAMELVSGETLRAKMIAGLARDEALRIAIEIARGLARAHDKGIVHRDLKPENVMITVEGDVKVLDFGLAKLAERVPEEAVLDDTHEAARASRVTEDGLIIGTPAYMSPEQARGNVADIDLRSDVFSFGSMLYEMLSGVCPFHGNTNIEILYRVLHVEPKPLSEMARDLPPHVSATVTRCLEKDRAARFASARELLVALDPGVSGRVSDLGSARTLAAAPVISSTPGITAALAPTVSESPAAENPPEKPVLSATTAPRRRAWIPAVALLACLSAIAAFSFRARHSAAPEAPPAPSSSAPHRGVAITDHPLPTSGNPEAIAHYASALRRLRVGAMQSGVELRKAIAADPTLAPAQLRLALYGGWYQRPQAEQRESFLRASALRGKLDARDQSLLPLAEILSRNQAGYDAAFDELTRLEAQSPDDAELTLIHFNYLTKVEMERAARMGERALALDPGMTQIHKARADYALEKGDLDGCLAAADECISRSPAATQCHELRAQALAALGRCDEALRDARELIQLEPDLPAPRKDLAMMLLATGAPVESARTAFAESTARDVDRRGTPRDELLLAIYVGDFAASARLAESPWPEVTDSPREFAHSELASLQIAIADERGEPNRSLEIADAFERRASAWVQDAPLGMRAERVYMLRARGKISDAELSSKRDALALEAASLGGSMSAAFWAAMLDARFLDRAREARGALIPWPDPETSYNTGLFSSIHQLRYYTARANFLFGDVGRGMGGLEQSAGRCVSVPQSFSAIGFPELINQQHARLYVGEARATEGDIAGACEAYGLIVKQWKNAKPRSVTLEKAKARMAALKCPSP